MPLKPASSASRAAAHSGKKKQAKQAGSAFAGAGNSVHEQDGAARFLTKPSAAAVLSGPLVLIFTHFHGPFRLLEASAPNIGNREAVRRCQARRGWPASLACRSEVV